MAASETLIREKERIRWQFVEQYYTEILAPSLKLLQEAQINDEFEISIRVMRNIFSTMNKSINDRSPAAYNWFMARFDILQTQILKYARLGLETETRINLIKRTQLMDTIRRDLDELQDKLMAAMDSLNMLFPKESIPKSGMDLFASKYIKK